MARRLATLLFCAGTARAQVGVPSVFVADNTYLRVDDLNWFAGGSVDDPRTDQGGNVLSASFAPSRLEDATVVMASESGVITFPQESPT